MNNLLKPRLQALANLVEPGATLIDIGCDHGYLVIDLALNKIIKKGYACDVNKGPLQNAQNNITKYNLDIQCFLSNGFKEVLVDDYDTICIAGMGGTLIVDILKQHPDLKEKTLLLQPNINSYLIRQYLQEIGLKIVAEQLVKEKDIVYEVIKAKGLTNEKFTDFQLRYGQLNLLKQDELIKEKLAYDYKKNQTIIDKITDEKSKQHFINLNHDIEEYLDEIK